jgi:hypothetical protein
MASPAFSPFAMAVPPMDQKEAHTAPETLFGRKMVSDLGCLLLSPLSALYLPITCIVGSTECSVLGQNWQNIWAGPPVDWTAVCLVLDLNESVHFADCADDGHGGRAGTRRNFGRGVSTRCCFDIQIGPFL